MPDDVDRDEQALLLREQGRSFAGIARALELANGIEATAAFNRALRRHTPGYQVTLRNHEMARLDALTERLRQREGMNDEELARLLVEIKRLRKALFVA